MPTITRFDYEDRFPEQAWPLDRLDVGTWTHDVVNHDALQSISIDCGCLFESWHGGHGLNGTGSIACRVSQCESTMHDLAGHEIVTLCEKHR